MSDTAAVRLLLTVAFTAWLLVMTNVSRYAMRSLLPIPPRVIEAVLRRTHGADAVIWHGVIVVAVPVVSILCAVWLAR